MMQEQEYEIKRGKHPAIKGKRQKRFIRFKSLGDGYTQEDIEKRIRGEAEPEQTDDTPKKRWLSLIHIFREKMERQKN